MDFIRVEFKGKDLTTLLEETFLRGGAAAPPWLAPIIFFNPAELYDFFLTKARNTNMQGLSEVAGGPRGKVRKGGPPVGLGGGSPHPGSRGRSPRLRVWKAKPPRS